MMKHIFSSLALLFFTAGIATAATDDFIVRQQIGADSTPPSTPTALTATPVASSQIDLSWGASTDDVSLGGYQLFRDAVQIATTTLTTHSDSGLTASTTYSYYVTAFDTFFNISSTSNTAATTTLGITPTSTPPVDDSNGGDGPDVKLISFEIIPEIHAAQLTWETDRYAQFELRWGRTNSYEIGFVSNELFKREHATRISDLEAGTKYEYQLIAYDRDGDRFTLSKGTFNTKNIPDATAPTNVSNLAGTLQGNDIALTWTLPSEDDFSHIRIVRSHLFYPVDAYDGFIAYQGTGDSFLDKNAGAKKNIQYYTVFSYDHNGNISSGAVVAVSPKNALDSDEQGTGSQPLVLDFADLQVVQNDRLVSQTQIDANLPFTLRIAYEKLPEHLKTITATLFHPADNGKSFSFLMRINKDKTHYEASLAPLKTSGNYPAVVSVFDHQTQKLYEARGSLGVVQNSPEHEDGGFLVPLTTGASSLFKSSIVWITLLLLLLWILLIAIKRIYKDTSPDFYTHKGTFVAIFALLASLAGASMYAISSSVNNEVQEAGKALALMSGMPHALLTLDANTVLILLLLALPITIIAGLVFLKKK